MRLDLANGCGAIAMALMHFVDDIVFGDGG
jgi:hypothetical protein